MAITSSPPAVLITGCSSGIGRATALRFLEAGHPTYATARRPEAISDLADAGCTSLHLDVTDQESISGAVAAVERDHGAVGILVNNAGIGLMTPMETAPLSEVRRQYETNVFGLLAVSQAVIPAMREARSGRIVNIGSSGGEFTTPGGGAYQATKYAVHSMTDAMRMELRSFGIDVVLIEPGAVASQFGNNGAVLGAEEGHYTQMMRGVEKVANRAIEPGAPGTWSPDQIADVTYRAGTTRRPRTRYRPGVVAKSLVKARAWLPDRAWDAMFVAQLKRVGG